MPATRVGWSLLTVWTLAFARPAHWIVALFGAAGMTADRLAFAVITTIYLLLAIPWEERSLGRAFGSGTETVTRRLTSSTGALRSA